MKQNQKSNDSLWRVPRNQKYISCFLIFSLVLSGLSCGKREESSQKAKGEKEGLRKTIEFKIPTTRPFIYDSQGKRDPFVPLSRRGDEGPILAWLKLEGILWDPDSPKAIINDEIVGKGDKIKGAEVIDIKEDRVILRYEGEQYILRLKE